MNLSYEEFEYERPFAVRGRPGPYDRPRGARGMRGGRFGGPPVRGGGGGFGHQGGGGFGRQGGGGGGFGRQGVFFIPFFKNIQLATVLCFVVFISLNIEFYL